MDLASVIVPSALVSLLVSSSLGFFFYIKQRRFEEKELLRKKVRSICSSLLLIWHEYSSIERFLIDNDDTDSLMFSIPLLIKETIQIDQKKITLLREEFIIATQYLKEIDTNLFFILQKSLEYFDESNNEYLRPLLKGNIVCKEDFRKMASELLRELLDDLEKIVKKLANKLPLKEKTGILTILSKHKKELTENEPRKIPQYLISVINNSVQPKINITETELNLFYSNKTMMWLISKFLTKTLQKKLFKKGTANALIVGLSLINKDERKLNKIISEISKSEIVSMLTLTDEENQKFINNKEFCKLLLGFLSKFHVNAPYEIKRNLIKLNSGQISIQKELEKALPEILQEHEDFSQKQNTTK